MRREKPYLLLLTNAVKEWLDSITVPAELSPNYSECLYFYRSKDDNSEIIILWDTGNKSLHVVESFL